MDQNIQRISNLRVKKPREFDSFGRYNLNKRIMIPMRPHDRTDPVVVKYYMRQYQYCFQDLERVNNMIKMKKAGILQDDPNNGYFYSLKGLYNWKKDILNNKGIYHSSITENTC